MDIPLKVIDRRQPWSIVYWSVHKVHKHWSLHFPSLVSYGSIYTYLELYLGLLIQLLGMPMRRQNNELLLHIYLLKALFWIRRNCSVKFLSPDWHFTMAGWECALPSYIPNDWLVGPTVWKQSSTGKRCVGLLLKSDWYIPIVAHPSKSVGKVSVPMGIKRRLHNRYCRMQK